MPTSTQCWFCGRVKGKRSCPAHGGDPICSRCCGTKRRVAIACPEDCPYLEGAHDPRRREEERARDEERFFALFAGTPEERLPLLAFLHHVLLLARHEAGGLDDEETLEIVETLARTFETLSKGILYEHQPGTLRLQGLVRRLAQFLERRGELAGVPPATDAELAASLAAIAEAIRAHRRQGRGGRTYLDRAEGALGPVLETAPPLSLPGGPSDAGRLIVEP